MKEQNAVVLLKKEDFDPLIFNTRSLRSDIKFVHQDVEGWIKGIDLTNAKRVMIISNLIWKKLK
jgi:hypothetical protein